MMRKRRKPGRTMIRAGILVALLAILCAMLFVPDREGQSLFAYLYDQLLEADINLKRRYYVPDYYVLSELYDLHSFCKWYFPDFEYYWTYRELLRPTNTRLLETYGEPDEVIVYGYFEGSSRPYAGAELRYGGRIYRYYFYEFLEDGTPDIYGEAWFLSITLTSPEDTFGRAKLHVGSTRRDVLKALFGCPRVNETPPGEKYYWNMQNDYIIFTYDENDIVTTIRYCL